jgi:dehydrogenase/reductase SDR family protein 7B
LALQLSKQNSILILTSSNSKLLEALKAELQTKTHILPYNLLHIEGISELVNDAIQLEGGIDCIIQSAGISQRSLANETSIEVYKKLMDTNYFAPLALTQAILPYFKKKNLGSITVISSIAGLIGFPLRKGYCASKHAIKRYLETLHDELFKTNIHICIVYLGRINTTISRNALVGNGTQFGSTDENNQVRIDVSVCANNIIKGISNKKNTLSS